MADDDSPDDDGMQWLLDNPAGLSKYVVTCETSDILFTADALKGPLYFL